MKSCKSKTGGHLGPTGHRWKFRKHIRKGMAIFMVTQLSSDHRVVFTCADCGATLRVHSDSPITTTVEPLKRKG